MLKFCYCLLLGYRTRSLLSVGEKAASDRIIKELLYDENVDEDYRLYELLSKRQDLSTGMYTVQGAPIKSRPPTISC